MNKKSISIEGRSEVYTPHSGLFILDKIWKSLRLDKTFKTVLPRKKRKRGLGQIDKLKGLVFSFAIGNDSLSDLDHLNGDQLFRELIGGNSSSTSMGDFLRSFGNRHVERFQERLIEAVLELRLALYPEDKKFILTMDSTPHEHYAKKMEGLAWNYKNKWCLDSQNIYDQYGFSYLFDLRPGNTYSGKDAERWIHEVFKKIPEDCEKWFRADTAYSGHQKLEALESQGVKFTIALKNNVGRYVRKRNHLEWKKTKLRFFDSDKCEVAMGLYPVNKLGNLRVVFIRAPKEDEQLDLMEDFEEQGYRYYSIITNVDRSELNEEEVIEFYRQRATAENYIKEQKYGYDFLNFPCQKLRANQVFGLAGTIAHNLMRALSLMMEQKVKRVRGKDGKLKTVVQQGYYSKEIRNKLIRIAGRVTSSARRLRIRVNEKQWEVAKKVMKNLEHIVQRYVPYKDLRVSSLSTA